MQFTPRVYAAETLPVPLPLIPVVKTCAGYPYPCPSLPRNKGKDRDWTQIEEPNPAPPNTIEEDPFDEEEDLYNPAPLPPNPTRRQVRTALHDKSIAGLCGPSSFSLVDEENASGSSSGIQYNPEEFPEALNNPEPMDMDFAPTRSADYSPSRPQSVAANETIA
ncbi:hypothetical protein BGY98DRAFT_1096220 [Russula aff. rugulosa BPL654]|nr:hypothetical protein BGY98DRAFT_1096220 [Russula aff. rugulosa BPL654]